MGFLHRFSRLRIKVDESKCNRCGVCDSHCAVGAIDKGVIRVEHCQFCHACIDHCDHAALSVVDAWAARAAAKQNATPAKAPRAGESPST